MGVDETTPKVALFLDGPNVYRGSRELGKPIEPEHVIASSRPFGRLLCATVYLAMKDGVPADHLARKYSEAGFSVRFVPCAYNSKDIDTTMAVEISEAVCGLDVDVVVIASGDGDFVPAVDLAHRKGKVVVICAFPEGCNPALRSRGEVFVALGEVAVPVREVTTYHA